MARASAKAPPAGKAGRAQGKGQQQPRKNSANGEARKVPATPVEFLEGLRVVWPHALSAADPDNKLPFLTVPVHDAGAVETFVQQHDGKRNLYYSVNPLRRTMSKKAEKTDVAAIEYALADLDPADGETPEQAQARYLSALRNGAYPPPTVIVNSGGGIQALWKLETPIPLGQPARVHTGKKKAGRDDWKWQFTPKDQAKVSDVEARIAAIMVGLGAKPGTQNIDRIFRLPFTTNLPNAKKKKAGRVPCPATLIEFNDKVYPLDAFPLPKPGDPKPSPRPNDPEPAPGKVDLNKLPQNLRLMLFAQGAEPAGYKSRSELFWAFINEALRLGIDESQIVELCCDPTFAGCSIFEHVSEQKGDSEDYVKAQIAHALNKKDPDLPSGDKAIIRLKDGKTDEAWRATKQQLIKRKLPIFVRGKRLVHPQWKWEKDSDDRNILAMGLEQYNEHQFADMIQHNAVMYQKFDLRLGKSGKWKNVDPPIPLVERMLTMGIGHWIEFPTIRGIVNSPVLRPDGSILSTPGYDPKTALWYISSAEVNLPDIPAKPTREEAKEALRLLDGLISGFPFKADDDGENRSRSVALAAIMTTVLRGGIIGRAVPIFVVTAPNPRTGKTYFVVLCSYIATGHRPIHTAASQNHDEMEKRIETAALVGRPLMSLNNIPNGMNIQSEALAQASTEGTVNVRTLGKMKEGECDCSATTIFLNGNNIQVVGDLVERTLVCRLDANTDKPYARTFSFDPVAEVMKDRGKYLAAIFTIVRAYQAAGGPTPERMTSVAGFEKWSKLVQQPLMWLGLVDPFSGIEDNRSLDPTQGELERLIEVLKKHVSGQFTVADLVRRAEEKGSDARGREYYKHEDLREIMTFHGRINRESFGHLLKRHRDRPVDGLKIIVESTGRGRKAYRLYGLKDNATGAETTPNVAQEGSPADEPM